jgi:hypothetical protein
MRRPRVTLERRKEGEIRLGSVKRSVEKRGRRSEINEWLRQRERDDRRK